MYLMLLKDNLFKNIFDEWDRVAAVECLSVLHYSIDYIFLSFEIIEFIMEL